MKREKERMTTGYYSHEPSAEWGAVERWENEGGRLREKRDYILDSAGVVYNPAPKRAGLMRTLNYEAIDCSGFSDFSGSASRRSGNQALA